MRQQQTQQSQGAETRSAHAANRVRIMREEAGLSQVELAVRAGIQPGLLCRYERGVSPSQRNALRLAKALGRDAGTLFPDFEYLRPY
ncbi:MAG: helix-turn-helix transcriptional regulator [bacterium]